ncbi:MAG: protein-disulfide reductase DsbD domain-containing protein [Pseudomonadota bacterium]
MPFKTLLQASLLLVSVIIAGPAAAMDAPETGLRLFAEKTQAAPGETIGLALQFDVKPGWHLYWKNPGDTGLEPMVRWSAPEGTTFDDLSFPTPEAFTFAGFTNYGYTAPFTLLTAATLPKTTTGDVSLSARVEWLACDDKICVPESGSVSVSLPVGQGAVSETPDPYFAASREALPFAADWDGKATIADGRFAARIAVPFEEGDIGRLQLFPAKGGVIVYEDQQRVSWVEPGVVEISMNAQTDALSQPVPAVLKAFPRAAGPAQGYEIALQPANFVPVAVTVNEQPASDEQGSAVNALGLSASLPFAVFSALIGGLILNLMPCVFPVLTLKALSFAQSGESTQKARSEGWFYTFGILASFLVLALVLLGLRAAGGQLGWGFQLQSPVIIAALALLMFVIGLNLLGAFEFSGRFAGAGQQWLGQQSGKVQSFFTGVLATVVATPCTAPFMATALSFAITQPAPAAILIFLSLGFGLALPFLLLSHVPALQRIMPKPGAWMDSFKQLLAFPMFATMLWLLWVLSNQTGTAGVILTLGIALLTGFAIWALQRAGQASGTSSRLYPVAAIGAIIIGLLGFKQIDYSQKLAQAVPAGLNEEVFSETRLSALTGGDDPVFVYFTADWCITCKANERLALKTRTVKDAFDEAGVKTLVADWTRRDDEIASVLSRFGRAGVPLYLYYPAGSKTPVELPQILRPGMLVSLVSDTPV